MSVPGTFRLIIPTSGLLLRDGLLDLLVLEDYWRGGNTRLFENLGGLKFKDVTKAAGLEIVTEERSFLTLSLDKARSTHREILAGFGIDRDRSPELGQARGAEVASAGK